jgi:DNA polymerase III subunit beta
MHTTTDAKALADALATLKRYAGNGNGSPKAAAVAELRVPDDGNALIVRRFAMRTNTDATASIAADRTTAGTVHVNADALAGAIKGASGPVTVAIDGDRVTVRTDGGSASLPVFDAADFPTAPTFTYGTLATVAASELDAFRGVLRAAGNGDARAVLASVYFDSKYAQAVATDTYRMHGATLADVRGNAIIPSDVLAIAAAGTKGAITIEATDDGGRFAVHYLRVTGTAKVPRAVYVRVQGFAVEGPYPNYASLIPDADTAVSVWSVADAAGTADVLSAFANKKNVPAVLAAAGSAVTVTASFPDGTRNALAPIAAGGDPIEIAFNAKYAAEAIAHSGDGTTVRIRDGLKAAHFTNGDRYALLMPMRVN